MNNNMITSYPSIICTNHESVEPYHNYSSYPMTYSEYPMVTSKSETLEYPYWPTIPTHNILNNPPSTTVDQISPSLSSNQTISSSQHHYPQSSISPSSSWFGSGDYQALHSTETTSPPLYRHYPTPCSFYPPNHFYDQSQPQWIPPSTVKFESSDCLNHYQEQFSKEKPSDLKNQSSPSHFSLIPPKNLLNGKTRTRDKYRIVYTDQQRYELENEFIVSKYISIPRKSALSLTLSLSERQIKIWFQNRRAKERKLNKKRHDLSGANQQLNNSNDIDSRSDGGLESPNYYPNYT